jgi:plastocyanin
MNSLDSRFLFHGDCFVQAFPQPGQSYRYGIGVSTLNRRNPAERPFVINVRESRDKGREEGVQHTVFVRSKGGQLAAEPPVVDIEEGDAVLWTTDDPATPGFSVSGYSETHSFSSAAMNSEAVYIHAFGIADIFKWGNVNGDGPSGMVEVTMPQTRTPREIEAYKERLSSEGAVVLISGINVEPAHVKICVGQTVFFIVEKADGITITDEKLIFEVPVPQTPFP